MNTIKPQIYVACLSAYNEGYLHGRWIDANQSVEELFAAIQNILASSPIPHAEEWAIHDHSGFGTCLSEYTSLETIVELAEFIAEHGELGEGILDHVNNYVEEARRMLENYHGEYSSEKDFAISLAEDTMEIPDHLSHYIDYERMAYDLFISDYISIEINHKTHVFYQY